MHYLALACDYDGTLAQQGRVDDETVAALVRIRETGRRVLLVTGRQLTDLRTVFSRFELFDCVVAENGAVLYRPDTREETALCERPPQELIDELRRRNVEPLFVGRVIVATLEVHQDTVRSTIRDLGLDLQIILNKGSVMVLPTGVNKATGLAAALRELSLSPRNVVAIGDAENDHAFLSLCGCGVAVANALPALQERADLVTEGDHGRGVIELIDRLIETDLADVSIARHQLPGE